MNPNTSHSVVAPGTTPSPSSGNGPMLLTSIFVCLVAGAAVELIAGNLARRIGNLPTLAILGACVATTHVFRCLLPPLLRGLPRIRSEYTGPGAQLAFAAIIPIAALSVAYRMSPEPVPDAIRPEIRELIDRASRDRQRAELPTVSQPIPTGTSRQRSVDDAVSRAAEFEIELQYQEKVRQIEEERRRWEEEKRRQDAKFQGNPYM